MEISTALGLTVCAIAVIVVWQIYRRKIERITNMPDIPATIPASGFGVPVLATFTGRKGSPRQVSFAHNNLNPYLTLFEDRLECRVLMQKAILLADIENVDIWDAFATRNVCVYVKGEEDVFIANLLRRRNLARVLDFLAKRGVPLSRGAKTFLSAQGR